MDTKTTLPISEARKQIFKISNDVQKSRVHYTFTDKGRPKVVLMSAEEFESWQETLEVTRNFPNLKTDIKKAEEDYKRNNYITLEEILAKEGFILANKHKKKHKRNEVSSYRSRKAAKRTK